jgi:ribosome maturation factor RimP
MTSQILQSLIGRSVQVDVNTTATASSMEFIGKLDAADDTWIVIREADGRVLYIPVSSIRMLYESPLP